MAEQYRTVLRITADLAGPVVSDLPIHLDGLLARVAYSRLDPDAAIDRSTRFIEPPTVGLPVRSVSVAGVRLWLASAGAPSEDAETIEHAVVRRPDSEDVDRRARRFSRRLGPGRDQFKRLPALAASSLTWWAVGSASEVREALAQITALGSVRAHGCGTVAQWTVEEASDHAPEECLVDGDGRARRNLPPSWCRASARGWGAVQFPYWHPDLQGPVVAVGAATGLLPAVLDALR